MENRSDGKMPTNEEIRSARHLGFTSSISHLPAEKRERLLNVYLKQVANRDSLLKETIADFRQE